MARSNENSTRPRQAGRPHTKSGAAGQRGSASPGEGGEPRNGSALVIVESPAKARTIARYLGRGFTVESSVGHIRDLPSTASEIPPEYKSKPWARIGVNVDDRFKPLYVIPRGKKSQVTKLKRLLKKAKALYLATDEDREGEAIAWHLKEVLDPKVPVYRMVFDEITEPAIREALAHPRGLNMQLVNAQEARRILDRLYGYEVSPVLWRKIGPKLSAGRVQSVATRLIVDRERERMRFVSGGYWDIEAELQASHNDPRMMAKLIELAGRRIATGKDFDPRTGRLAPRSDALLLDEQTAKAVAEALHTATFTVAQVVERPFTQRAHPPFVTSTLQQEAARKLRFSAARTMRLAQSLYENGYITYMRTDSVHLSKQALEAARKQVADLYGPDYLPDRPRTYKTKTKAAQEAHEAIRPAGATFRTPQELTGELEPDALRLYELIWKRTLACQMKDAVGRRTTIRIEAPTGEHGIATFTTSGKVIVFPGFLRAYVEGSDDPQAELEDQEKVLPPVRKGQKLIPTRVEPKVHETQPPPRYTEASLIKELEERGIGRPSTYATIIQTIQDRGYVRKSGATLVPTLTAFAVTHLLEKHFADLVDFDFTAKMEDDLDAIATGRLEAEPWLHVFYFGKSSADEHADDLPHIGLKQRVSTGSEKINPREVSTIPLGTNAQGEPIVARIGRYGPYLEVGDGKQRVTLPPDIAPDELTSETVQKLLNQAANGGKLLGHDPETGKPVYLKTGRFGPYVQLGDPERTEKGTLKRGTRPKMASLWPEMSPETLTLEDALLLLSFPKTLGVHPETGQPVTVQDGKYGPYVKMGDETRSLDSHAQLRTITLDEAVRLLAQPKRRGKRTAPATLGRLGTHPESGAPIEMKNGRFGPYVTDGVVNASLPKGLDPTSVTLEKALELIAAREQRLREQGKDPRAPKPARKARGKKSTARKA